MNNLFKISLALLLLPQQKPSPMYKKSINHSYDGIHEVKPRAILSKPAKNLHNWFLMRFKNQGHPVRQLANQDLRDV